MMRDELESISPELVLVSPELAGCARAALPERPWELFAPARRQLRPPQAVANGDPESAPPAGPPVAFRQAGQSEAPVLPAAPAPSEGLSPSEAALLAHPRAQLERARRPDLPAPLAEPRHAVRASRPPALPPTSPAPAQRSQRRRRGVPMAVMVLAGFAALFALSELPVADAPTLASPTGSSQARTEAKAPVRSTSLPATSKRSATKPASTTSKRSQAKPAPATSRPARANPAPATSTQSQATRPPATTKRSQVASARRPRAALAPAAIPGAGYVFGRDGRLVIGGNGRSITWFESRATCGLQVELSRIRISPSGTFAAQRSVRRGGKTGVVRLSGQVVSKTTIKGVLRGGPGACGSNREPFIARLS